MASGNDRLVRSISDLFDDMARLVALGFADEDDSPQIAGDHKLLAEALGSGDGKTAARIARRHIERFRDMTMERVLRSMKQDFEHAPLLAVGK
jgi:DNA-binding GntR family transcriptional regulator